MLIWSDDSIQVWGYAMYVFMGYEKGEKKKKKIERCREKKKKKKYMNTTWKEKIYI